ncbi:MAG: stalk domain-containing protein [Syntrophomonas sp.]
MKRYFLSLLVVLCLQLACFQTAFAAVAGKGDINLNFVPASPTGLQYTCSGAGVVTLTWTDNSNNESRFVIERKGVNDSSWFEIDTVAANTTSYVQSQESTYPIYPGESYCYRIKARGNTVSSGYSNELTVTVSDQTIPIAPGNIRFEQLLEGKLKVSWDDRSNNETKFRIEYWAPNTTAYYDETTESWLELSAYSFQKGTLYTFRVKAVNDSGSAYSEATFTTPASAPTAPVFYNNMGMAYLNNPSTMHVSWQDKSNNEAGFVILRKQAGVGEFNFLSNKVGIVDKNTTYFNDANLPLDQNFEYMIGSFTMYDHSFSSAVQAPITGPQNPVLTATTVSNGEVKLDWSCASSNVDVFIERKSPGQVYQRIKGWIYSSDNIHSFNDTGVSPGQTYYYKIYAGRNCPVNKDTMATAETSITVPTLPVASQNGAKTINTTVQFNNNAGSNINPPSNSHVITLNIGQTTYQLDGQQHQMDSPPVIYEGRTLLPIACVTEPLGAKLNWEVASQKITITLGDKTLELWIGKNTALVNGQEVFIDPINPNVIPIIAPPGRTLLPMSFISKNLGCQVDWDGQTQQAKITYSS